MILHYRVDSKLSFEMNFYLINYDTSVNVIRKLTLKICLVRHYVFYYMENQPNIIDVYIVHSNGEIGQKLSFKLNMF